MKIERLGDIADIIAGQSPPSSSYNKNGAGVPFFQGKTDYGVINPIVRNWCTEPTKISLPDDILISVRAPVGPLNINDVKACIGRGLSAIRVKENICRDYVYFFLKINEKKIANLGVGSTFTAITQADLKEIKIPLPPFPTQLHIANILTKAENLISQRKESIRLLDEYLKSTFLEMFGDPMWNHKDWKKYSMNDISFQITDGEHATPIRVENGIKLLSARNIKDGYLDYNSGLDYIPQSEYIRISKRCKPEKNDILMSCSGSVGRVSIVNTDEPFSLVRSVALIKLKKDMVNPLYIQSFMQTKYFQNQIKKGSKTSSQSNIFTGVIKKLTVFITPLELQTQFAQIVEKTEALKVQYQQSLKELENLYGSLSQRAFRGELTPKEYNLPDDYAQNSGLGMAAEP